MGDLIAAIATKTGVDPALVGKAVTIILAFIKREAPAEKVTPLIAAIPGASEAIAAAPSAGGGVMGVFNDLTAAGLGLGSVQSVARAFVGEARARAGSETVDAVVGSIPGLGQFV
jgi:hypothetical protein